MTHLFSLWNNFPFFFLVEKKTINNKVPKSSEENLQRNNDRQNGKTFENQTPQYIWKLTSLSMEANILYEMCRQLNFLLCILRFNQHWLTVSCKSRWHYWDSTDFILLLLRVYIWSIENISKINLANVLAIIWTFIM